MTDPTPTRAEVLLRRLREPAFGTETTERNLMAEAADMIQALRERAEAAEAERAEQWRQRRDAEAARDTALAISDAARRAEVAAWNDAIEAAVDVVDSNMLCGCGGSNGDEVLLPRSNPGNKLGFGYSRAIRALRRAAPTEGEA